jgi:hypothetical protein
METRQREICRRYNVEFLPCAANEKVGVSRNLRTGAEPINGLRHPPEGGTCGWYIWRGEFSEGTDFFVPLHASHLNEWCPSVLDFLGLPPGWRFLIDGDYKDIWFDASLLNI